MIWRVLKTIYDAYRRTPGEKIHIRTIGETLHVAEQQLIDWVAKLEQRGFVKSTWMERNALLEITEDGIAILKDN